MQKQQIVLWISKGLRALHRLPVIPLVSVVVAVVFVFNAAVPAKAADGIRQTINFQGKLVDQNGLNVPNGSYTVVFTLYNDPSAGSNLWDETQSVSTIDGVFQVELGTVDTTLGNVNFNSDLLYLGIKVGADAEMTPRIRFTAVPYAFNAKKVNGLTVTNTSDNPFSSATTLKIADGKTVIVNNGLTLAGTDSTTITFQGTDTYVGRGTTDTLTNKSIGSTGLTFSGAGTDITTVSNEDLTFEINGSGDLVVNSDFNSGVSIGSVSNTPAPLSVSGGIGSNASLVVNQTNSGDLFVASQAGATRFRIANNGDVALSAGINLIGSIGTASQCLLGGATASWGTCGTSAGDYWSLAGGLLYNSNPTTDFVIGGSASTSAKFKVSPSGTSPTASVSGNTSQAALLVDNTGFGDIFTASKSGATKFTIRNDGTLGLDTANYSNCGSLITNASALLTCGSAGVAGSGDELLAVYSITTASGANLTINFNGAVNSTPSSSSGTITFPSNASKFVVEVKGAGGGGGGSGAATAIKNAGGGGEGGFAREYISSLTSNYYIKVGGGGAGAVGNATGGIGTATCFGTNGSDACVGAMLSSNGGLGGAGVNSAVSATGGVGGSAAGGDFIAPGQAGFSSGAVATANFSGPGGGLGGGRAVTVAGANGIDGVNGGGGSGAGGITSVATSRNGGRGGDGYVIIYVYRAGSSGSLSWNHFNTGVLAPEDLTADVLIGGNSTASAKFAFINNSGSGEPTASIAGGITLRNGVGNINRLNGGSFNFQTSVGGDSGLSTKLFIANNGNIGIGTSNINPLAALDVKGNSATNPAASVSASSNFAALVVNNRGNGDLFSASSSGLNRFVIKQNGDVGIGTALPTALLDVNGAASISSSLQFRTGVSEIQTTANNMLTLGGDTTGKITLMPNNGAGIINFDVAAAGGLQINGVAGADVNASCVNAVNGIVTGGVACPLLNETWNGATSGIIFNGNITQDVLIGGNATASAKVKFSPSGTSPTALITANSSYAALITDNTGFGDLFAASKSGLTRFVIKNNGSVGVNTNGSIPQAALDVRHNSSTTPVASIAGLTNLAALIVNNSGNGELFAASSSGLSRFVIKQNGDVAIGTAAIASTTNYGSLQNVTNNLIVDGAIQSGVLGPRGTVALLPGTGGDTDSGSLRLYDRFGNPMGSLSADAGGLTLESAGANMILDAVSIQMTNLTSVACDVKASVTGVLSCGTDATGAGGTNYWNQANGLTYLGNLTTDLAIGGMTSASAKFRISMSGTQPTASIAGLTSNSALVVDNAGTGDLFTASSSGATRFTVKQNGTIETKGDIKIDSKQNSSNAEQTTWTKVSQTTPGTIDSGGTANIASVSASVSYNGSIYVGTHKGAGATGEAEVYRFDNNGANWTRVSIAAGQIMTGGTTNIASVSAMTVYDGRLYVGTSKIDDAEVYRYEGGTSWTKVSLTTAGDFNGTVTAQDGVSSMAIFNGKLYAGTREGAVSGGAARLLRYEGGNVWTAINTTGGTFVATTTAGVHAVSAMAVYNNTLFLGLSKAGDADVVRYGGTSAGTATFLAMNNATLANGQYRINGANVTAFDEVTTMAVYNNALILGMRKNNGAEVLALNYSPSVTAVDQDFTRLNNAVGQIAPGGTTNIDQVSAMTIYNGMLFIGTREGNSAEIYRYTGGDEKFFKVSQATAGTIASGGTASIDGISNMIPSNGDLYVGTMELGRAEVYKYTANIDRSFGLEFHANPQIAGGEQSGLDNHASIFYLASASANLGSANGNTGAFVFSHGIQTRNGSYDVAEDYATRDETLEPGELVSIDVNEKTFVRKSEGAYDANVIGVYSESPALRLSQIDSQIDGARAIPVALAGRVPVKVSTENGEIKSGDYLTASSKPGIAMKASKSGVVFGQAMGGYNETGVGKVTAYIKSSSYFGEVAETFAGFELTSKSSGKDILAALATQTSQEHTSEIVTDTLVAGLKIVSPEVTTKALHVDTIEAATGNDIGILLTDEGTLSVKNASGEAGMVVTGSGDAYFAGQVQTEGLTVTGTITADKLQVSELVITSEAWQQALSEGGLESIESRITSQDSRIANLETLFASASASITPTPVATDSAVTLLANMPTIEDFEKPREVFSFTNLPSDGLATVSGKLTVDRFQVTGSAIIEGLLHVVEAITARTLIVDELATFLGKVVFSGDVFFEGRPTFNNDTAGIAMVKRGNDRVEVTFEKEYDTVPMINVNLTLDQISPMPSEELENLTKRQEQLEERVLGANVRYVITKRTTKSFTILLDKPALDELAFSWIAITVDKPVVHGVNGDNHKVVSTQTDEKTRPISSIPLMITPTSSMEKREENLSSPQENSDGEEVSEHDSN